MAPDHLVVGGGIAGLVAARRLALQGESVIVLEQSRGFGGQVGRLPIGGAVLDAAADSFATRGGTVAALLGELGLADDIVMPPPVPAWLHRADGSAVPLPATALLGIPADPSADDVVRVIGQAAAQRALQDAELPPSVGADATTLGELVRARMGDGLLEGLVAPIVRGVHSREPDALPVATASPRLAAELQTQGSLAAAVRALRASAPAGSQVAGIRGGMFRLVDALVADCTRLGVTLETGALVDHVDAEGVTVDGVRRPGRVILAAADPTAAPPPRRQLTLVTLIVDAVELDTAPRGTGLLVAAGAPGVTARALTHLSAKWAWIAEALAGRHALRLSYDGVPDDPIAVATRDAGVLLGGLGLHADDAAVRTVERPTGGIATPRTDGITAVGERVAGTGLATIVAHADRLGQP